MASVSVMAILAMPIAGCGDDGDEQTTSTASQPAADPGTPGREAEEVLGGDSAKAKSSGWIPQRTRGLSIPKPA